MYTINIGGGFEYSSNIKLELLRNPNFKDSRINVFDSFGFCKWNGGRCNHGVSFSKEILNFYNKRGIGVFVTFTNSIIDLNDYEGNYYLEQINQSNLNGVILIDDNLRKYIRENFKNLKITRSVTYFKSDFSDLDIDDYKRAEENYDYIVPRNTDVLNPSFYNNVDKSKYEILVSNSCPEKCKFMHKHYEDINRYNRGELKEIPECILKNKKEYSFDINQLLSLGFSNFKISSRTNRYDLEDFFRSIKDFDL